MRIESRTVYRKDGNKWVECDYTENPEIIHRNIADDMYRRYICHGTSVKRIVGKYDAEGMKKVVVYYGNGFKSVYLFH